MKKRTILALLSSLLLPFPETAPAKAADWPQFRGLKRDGISPETGLLRAWPETGPPQVWRVPLGTGYSGIAVSGGRIYTMEGRGEDEFAICLDAATGKELWRTRIGSLFKELYGDGPRSTPLVDGDRIYVLGARGDFASLARDTGKILWTVDFREKFKSEVPIWGFASTAALVGERLILETGGSKETHTIAAFDKKTGEVLWTLPTRLMNFATPLVLELGGVTQVIFFNDENLEAVTPEGKVLWIHPVEPKQGIKIAMPVFVPPDLLFVSLSYDVGAFLIRMKSAGGTITVEPVWAKRDMRNHFNSSVTVGGYIYGFDNSNLKCIDVATGATKWSHRSGLGKGSLIYADGHLIVLSENGKLLWVEATPEQYRERASLQVFQGRSWTSPTLSDGRLYLRNQEEMVCLDLRDGAAPPKEGR